MHLFQPSMIMYCVVEEDLFDNRVIDYMERHDSFSLLETKVMDRVIRQMWEGSIDTGGSLFSLSTCYKIVTKGYTSYQKDFERTHRLVCNRNLRNKRHHPFTYRVYLKSMNFRYNIELILFIVVMIAFQYYIL